MGLIGQADAVDVTDEVVEIANERAFSAASNTDVPDLILDLIKVRDLHPGDKLPTEAEIARLFAMSRQKVRAGLLRLEALGIVRSRQGSGRVLLDRSQHTLPGLLAPSVEHSPSDILDAVIVRQVMEVGFLPSAIEVIDGVAISAMQVAIDRMRRCATEGKPFVEADRAFHDALYIRLNNQLLSRLLSNFWDLFASIDLDVLRHREGADETIRHHQNILEAVECGEVAVAQFHMKMHFFDAVESLRDFVARS